MGYGHDGDGDFDYEAGRAEWEAEMRREDFFPEGDARVCPSHPNVKTSSADGMFDAPCGRCEYEMSLAEDTDADTDAAKTIVGLRMGAPVYLEDFDDDCPF